MVWELVVFSLSEESRFTMQNACNQNPDRDFVLATGQIEAVRATFI